MPSSDVTATFRLTDYDCVGFDLDNTLCEYRVGPMARVVYDALAEYLVAERGYSAERMRAPVDPAFMQRGLVLDAERGNVLKLDGRGRVLRASHGTRFMDAAETVAAYGPQRTWTAADALVRDFRDAWNGPVAELMRPLLDYFDTPASLAFARCVDDADAAAAASTATAAAYRAWPDVLAGLGHMYAREQFAADAGGFFGPLKAEPSLHYRPCPGYVVDWLRALKSAETERNKKTVVFLVSGSNADYAALSATQALGPQWRELFDVAVFFARKPGFFTADRPFLQAAEDQMSGETEVSAENLRLGDGHGSCSMYSQGNWNQLLGLFKKETGLAHPKCLYVGDNVLQDIVAPSRFCGVDTVAVCEEMKMDGGCDGYSAANSGDDDLFFPNKWSSYLADREEGTASLWTSFIAKHARLCVPSVRALAQKPLNYEFPSFCKSRPYNGFFPSLPHSLQKIVKCI